MSSYKQQHSASLIIVQENPAPIDFIQNSFQVNSEPCQNLYLAQKIDDTFELSLDQHSLSFQIQQSIEQSTCNNILKQGTINTQLNIIIGKPSVVLSQQPKHVPVIHEQRKRKRKQIFEKYKQKTIDNPVIDSGLDSNTNDLINTIDQIFKIKSPEKTQIKTQKQSPVLTKNFSLKGQQKTQITGFKKKQSALFQVAKTSFEVINQTNSGSKKINPNFYNAPLVGEQNRFSITQFQIPSNINESQRIDPTSNLVIGSTNSFIVQSEINKLSMIQVQQGQASRDSVDIEAFLKSQIFRDDNLQKTIQRYDTSYKNIQISMVNPSIMMQNNLESPINTLYSDHMLGLTKDKSESVLPTIQNDSLPKRSTSQRRMKVFDAFNLQPRTIIKQKVLNYEESRIPEYLREIRKKNTIFPNFYLKPKSKDFYRDQNVAYKELLSQFKKGASFLDSINELAYERYTILSQLQKKLLNSLSLQTFMNSGWQKVKPIKQLSLLQPRQNFNKRKYEYEKVKGALNNYLYIAQYYEKIQLNLEDPKAQKKYLQIRAKFWQIEKNIKMIGQDIYLLAVQQVFPPHYIDFFNALRGQFPRFSKPLQQLEYAKNFIARYYALRNGGDLLCLSEVGTQLRLKMQKMVQKALMI